MEFPIALGIEPFSQSAAYYDLAESFVVARMAGVAGSDSAVIGAADSIVEAFYDLAPGFLAARSVTGIAGSGSLATGRVRLPPSDRVTCIVGTLHAAPTSVDGRTARRIAATVGRTVRRIERTDR